MSEEPVSRVHVNGVDLEYLDEGTGDPVVFSHGGGSDLRYWEPQRRAFAERHRFVAYSHRYHGRGRWPTDAEYSAAANAEDLVAIMRRLDGGPVHLIGFSTAIALRATLIDPSFVRSLTIIEPNIPWLLEGDAEGEAILAGWREATARVRLGAAADAERQARLWFELVNNRGPGSFDIQPQPFRRMWLDNFGSRRPASPPAEPLTCGRIGALATRTLVLGAEHGMAYSRRIADRAAECLTTSRLAIVPDATHFMSYQAPDAFNQIVLEFLSAA
jgi:pimeloyl-ACP methyl ester carboxylesterase